MKKILLITLLFFIVSCSNIGYFSNEEEIQEENLAQGKVIDYNKQSLYEVTSSDSLASIARRYGTTADTIILMNNLKRPYSLKPGMLIKIPTIKTIDDFDKTDKEESESVDQKIIQIKPSKKK
ncbi:MAG: LysM peptidoglycan-binding domain-containing protein [Rickettsiales bacterium]|nr:LysM peptidoglycan-binding domain-containing protein [Rickettsiales bacterium]